MHTSVQTNPFFSSAFVYLTERTDFRSCGRDWWGMNPLHWEDAFRRPHGDQDPYHQTVNNSIMDNTSGTDIHWHAYSRYSRYTDDETQHRLPGVKSGSERFGFPSQNFYTNESELEELDGKPMQTDEDDPVLPRMRRELREQEEQMCKKFAPALKTVKPFVETLSPAFASNKQCDTYNGASLKDRVNFILQQWGTLSFDSDVSNQVPDR